MEGTLEDGHRMSVETAPDPRGWPPGPRDSAAGGSSLAAGLQIHSTSGGLGVGLSGACRLMDERNVDSALGQGALALIRKREGAR